MSRGRTAVILPDRETLWLLVVLLLLLWLLTRTRQAEAAKKERRKPMTEHELGRVIFEIARSADLESFRHLYLTGGEAREVMGELAGAYLGARDKRWLEDELVEIGARIGERSAYVGARIGPESMVFVRLRGMDGQERELPAGRAIQLGRIWRLRDPVGDWTRYGRESATA
jgi:hypothetical protein